MKGHRVILHVDMDAFFAAIAELDDPSLKGKAVLIGGDSPRSVVTTANYEARKFGCGSAMPMAVAKRRCPHAVIVSVPGERIREKSKSMFAVLDDFSPLVQPLSVDEAFLDMTGMERLMGPPVQIAQQLKDEIKRATGLTASVGVAPNKLLAKLASDLEKPDGLTVITPENLDAVLAPLPIAKLWGVGPATETALHRRGIQTVGDLRGLSEAELVREFGDLGGSLFRRSRGIDARPVVPDRTAKSIGHEQTFKQNLETPDAVREFLYGHTEAVARRVRQHGFTVRGVTVKIRDGEFHTVTRSTTLDPPTDRTDALWQSARGLFDAWADSQFVPVRLVGVSAGPLNPPGSATEQLGLFTSEKSGKQRALDAASDAIVAKFGADKLHHGSARPNKRRR
ncbi:MAG: DNA polymerase IV [Planctomycetota bacterium]